MPRMRLTSAARTRAWPAATVTASYTDPDAGDAHTFDLDLTTDATKGKVTDNGDGTFSYDPNGAFASLAAGQSAADQFLYTVTDGSGATSTATVTITITGQNDAPNAANISGAAPEHGPAATVTASYTDPDAGDTHTFSVDLTTAATKGKVTNKGDGTFTYDPNGAFESLRAGQTATDQFLYTVTDGSGASSTATVAITITGQGALSASDIAGLTSTAHRSRSRPRIVTRSPTTRPLLRRPHDRRDQGQGDQQRRRTFTYDPNGFESLRLGRPRPTSSSTRPFVRRMARARPRRRRSPSRSPVRTMPRLRPTSAAPFRNTGPRRR